MKDSPTRSRVLQLAHPPIPIVRIGIIGLGNRGLLTLQRYLQIEGTTDQCKNLRDFHFMHIT